MEEFLRRILIELLKFILLQAAKLSKYLVTWYRYVSFYYFSLIYTYNPHIFHKFLYLVEQAVLKSFSVFTFLYEKYIDATKCLSSFSTKMIAQCMEGISVKRVCENPLHHMYWDPPSSGYNQSVHQALDMTCLVCS